MKLFYIVLNEGIRERYISPDRFFILSDIKDIVRVKPVRMKNLTGIIREYCLFADIDEDIIKL